jgi:hypothetical protein
VPFTNPPYTLRVFSENSHVARALLLYAPNFFKKL